MNAEMERQHRHEEDEDEGLQSGVNVVGGEHVEKKSVLKKVKAKAKKIKDSITKHGHGSHESHQSHDQSHDDDDDEIDDDPEVHGAPIYESKEVQNYLPGQTASASQSLGYTSALDQTSALHQPHNYLKDPTPKAHEQEHKYRSFIPEQVGVSKHNGVTFGGSQTQKPAPQSFGCIQGVGMGIENPAIFDRPTALEADPHAPGEDNPPENYETKVKDPTGRGGKEIQVTPILPSLDKMKTNDDKIEPQNAKTVETDHLGVSRGTQGLYSGGGSHDQISPEPMSYDAPQQTSSYTEKVSSATSAVADKAMLAKNELASKLGYGVVDHPEKTTSFNDEDESAGKPSSVTEYGKKVASTVQEKLAPVYDKVAGAGGGLLSSESESEEVVHDKGVSAKEYIAEKVSPKEEDKALSEVISGALHMPAGKQEEEKKAEPTGKVTFSAKVIRQLGTGEEKSAEDIGSGGSGPGETVVDMLKDTVTSWLGMGGGNEPSTLVFHDIPKDGNEGFSEHNQQSGQGTDGKPRLQ